MRGNALSYFRSFIAGLAAIAAVSVYAKPPVVSQTAPEYAKMFEYSRELLSRKPVRDFLREVFREELQVDPKTAALFNFTETSIKEVSESQFMLLLEKNPGLWDELDEYLAKMPSVDPKDPSQNAERKIWRDKFRKLIQDNGVKESFQKLNNPLEAHVLETAPGQAAYLNRKLYVNHEITKAGVRKPADDLKQVVRSFIGSTENRLIMNFFDFDLMDVADDLVALAGKGKEIRVGIDANVAEARPEVAAVRDRLRTGGVFVHEVDSVGLNHQKMIATDWDIPGKGRVLLSSGNLTQSCIGPEGDLVQMTPRPSFSVPNANHMITLDSDLLSQLVNHELTKTIDPKFQLRGSQYPMSGAYKLFGPTGKDGKPTYMIITFTPGGGLKSVNHNMIARVVRETDGPVHMAQFAFSSDSVQEALLERAARETAKAGRFEFKAVADTSFSVQPWSGFLKMSGLELQKEGDTKHYAELAESPWRKTLGEKQLDELRKNIRIAPPEYGTHHIKANGEALEATGKLHHKMLISGDAAIMGTSFNFSTGAETNQEQLVVFVDREMADDGRSIVESLAVKSERSVYEETVRRNTKSEFRVVDDPDVDRPVKRAPANAKAKPGKNSGKCAPAVVDMVKAANGTFVRP
ncbi:MAG: hypothetical protein A2X94_01720 [Bdellovibrionales bacterium GWB1_55_8]|nr:MAG: hypothetical protein A2X94_01720 [Bdellovibrionales bacterium GWB1_55_8]